MILRNFNIQQIRKLSYKKIISWYSGLVKAKLSEAPFNHIAQIGDPTLRSVSEIIPQNLIQSDEIQFLINRMKKVMKSYNCVGLSAPQIGVPFRLFLFELNQKHLKDYTEQERKVKEIEEIPLTVAINPEVKITDYSKLTFTESCESVRGFSAEVPRYKTLKLQAFNSDGEKFEINASGWTARIIQHEMDHLDGTFYTDRMVRKTFACSCWQLINERGGKVELPFRAQ